MTATLMSMALPVGVLLVAGTITFGAAWWATLRYESKDEWLLGDNPQ